MQHRRCQKAADPVFIRRGHGIHTTAHAEHIPYRHFFQVLAGFFWRFIWENINHFIIKVQQPFGAGNANRCGDVYKRQLYMVFAPNLYPNYPDGKEDNTHLRYLGAVRFTGLVAAGLQALGGPYADVLLGTPERDKYDGKGYEG